MKITNKIHAIKIPFKVPLSPELSIDRFAFVYLIFGAEIHLIDSGVAGAELTLFEYIKEQGREMEEISNLILTHSHPDHIGAANIIKNLTGCIIFAHKTEQNWIENTEQQFKERPVPGFQDLVAGSVKVDHIVEEGNILQLEKGLMCRTIHTPGHSKGSISLLFENENSLFTGDALVYPGDLPIYEDIFDSISSIKFLQKIKNINYLFSSWEPPVQGQEDIRKRMEESIGYLQSIHNTVISCCNGRNPQDIMELCKTVTSELGLPPFAVNSLVAKAFASSLSAGKLH